MSERTMVHGIAVMIIIFVPAGAQHWGHILDDSEGNQPELVRVEHDMTLHSGEEVYELIPAEGCRVTMECLGGVLAIEHSICR